MRIAAPGVVVATRAEDAPQALAQAAISTRLAGRAVRFRVPRAGLPACSGSARVVARPVALNPLRAGCGVTETNQQDWIASARLAVVLPDALEPRLGCSEFARFAGHEECWAEPHSALDHVKAARDSDCLRVQAAPMEAWLAAPES